jgi:hypothetical protein
LLTLMSVLTAIHSPGPYVAGFVVSRARGIALEGFKTAALDYVAKGFEVFPLQGGGKAPLGGRGVLDATNDAERVSRWWSAYPTANIGLRVPEKHFVLDIDPRNGGMQTVEELFGGWDFASHTAIAASGSMPDRGFHVWFRAAGQVVGKLGEGIDVKTHSGYVVAPPSIHPSGLRYEWLNEHAPAQAPGFVLDLVLRPAPRPARRIAAPASRNGLVEFVANSQGGNAISAFSGQHAGPSRTAPIHLNCYRLR